MRAVLFWTMAALSCAGLARGANTIEPCSIAESSKTTTIQCGKGEYDSGVTCSTPTLNMAFTSSSVAINSLAVSSLSIAEGGKFQYFTTVFHVIYEARSWANFNRATLSGGLSLDISAVDADVLSCDADRGTCLYSEAIFFRTPFAGTAAAASFKNSPTFEAIVAYLTAGHPGKVQLSGGGTVEAIMCPAFLNFGVELAKRNKDAR